MKLDFARFRMIAEAAKRAAALALADFLKARIDYHLGGIVK